jgi:hypothetical protein
MTAAVGGDIRLHRPTSADRPQKSASVKFDWAPPDPVHAKGHVTVRTQTGLLERNIGFGAKEWIADWRLRRIWKLTRFESHGPKMRKLNLGSMRHAAIRNRPATFPAGSA